VAGVCGFVLPSRDLANAVRVWRFIIAVLSALAGLYGTVAGMLILLIHLSGLKSLDINYLSCTGHILRKRLKKELYRTVKLNPEDKRNQK
jgi:spore germination protein KA